MQPYIKLLFIPSPLGLNWESPTTLARDILKNKISGMRRFMGHVNIEIKVGDHHVLTGMRSDTLNGISLLLKDKIGLGIVFHSFEGILETKEELDIEHAKYYKNGNKDINWVKFNVSEEVAQRAYDYYKKYKDNGLGAYYGLVNSPLHAEGSGCSAFGASFLIASGLIEEEFINNWSNRVNIPLELAGKPLTDNKVNFLKMVIKKQEWSKTKDNSYELMFWDPDLMHSWVEKQLSSNEFQQEKNQNARGIVIDKTHISPPKEDIFQVSSLAPKLPDLSSKSNMDKYKAIL